MTIGRIIHVKRFVWQKSKHTIEAIIVHRKKCVAGAADVVAAAAVGAFVVVVAVVVEFVAAGVAVVACSELVDVESRPLVVAAAAVADAADAEYIDYT